MRTILLALVLALASCNCSEREANSPRVDVGQAGPDALDEEAEETDDVDAVETAEPRTTPGPRLDASRASEARDAIREGRRLTRAEDFDAALAAFDRALEILPGAPRLRCEAGYVAHRAGQDARAARLLDAALAIHPRPRRAPEELRVPLAMCLYNRGRVHEAMGHANRAEGVYRASLALRPNAIVEARLAVIVAAQDEDGETTRPRTHATPEQLAAWVAEPLCGETCDSYDGDEEWDTEDCAVLGSAEVSEDEGAQVDGAALYDTRSDGCLIETTGTTLTLRGSGGWWRTELCGEESSTTDSFFSSEMSFSCEGTVRRESPSIVVVDLSEHSNERYGDMIPPPADEENDPGCLADHYRNVTTHALVVCRTDGATPQCARLVLGEATAGQTDVYCEQSEELPAWAAAMQTADDDDDEPTVEDLYRLTFDGDVLVVARIRQGEEAGLTPGRYTLEQFFEMVDGVVME